jgi:hypothetical protein
MHVLCDAGTGFADRGVLRTELDELCLNTGERARPRNPGTGLGLAIDVDDEY